MSETEEKAAESTESHSAAEPNPDEEIDLGGEFPLEDDFQYVRAPSLKELLQSPDSPSRYLTVLSVLFSLFAFICLFLLVSQYLKRRHAEQKTVAVVEKLEVPKTITTSLGEFSVSYGNAEMKVEIVAECTTAEACSVLKEKLIEARDLTLPVLESSSRDEILNPDKKLLLRRSIADKLNELNLGGKVLQIEFTDLTLEVAHPK